MVTNGFNNEDIFQGQGVEVYLENDEDFLKIRETLTRIGIPDENRLSQICYILHKRGRYVIAHYKELMCLDGVFVQIDPAEIGLRNTITGMLEDWGLLGITYPDVVDDPQADEGTFRVIAHKEKRKWRLISPYRIGIDKRPNPARSPSIDKSEVMP